ncbi:MAG: lamin tail domain-containing protein, partial [Actinobacteria bacterium]|nr:lamin tail domain-containing protein [Actinomycetota bacterium]
NSTYGADWFEVTNTTGSAVTITGWKVDDSSSSPAAALALNGVTSIAAGESVIFIESASPSTIAASFRTAWFGGSPPAGLQIGTYSGSGIGLSTSGDAVNLYDASNALLASVSFGASDSTPPYASFDNASGLDNSTISLLSSPGVNGAFTSADTTAIGSPGTIVGSGPPPSSTTTTTTVAPTSTTVAPAQAWPGGSGLATVDLPGLVTSNLSGLTYEGSGSSSPGVIWAVQNGPGTLFQLVFDGTNWVPASGDWLAGKALKYPGGSGNPDAEGVTMGGPTSAGQLFVSTERNNDASSVSKNAILRFDPAAAGTTLEATAMWDLTADLPANGANLGLEAITWVPDSYLVSNGLVDDSTSAAYDPASYPNHGTGLFFVGVEATGTVYAYALDLTGTSFHRVASFSSGFPAVMAFEFDPETGDFWTHCDNTCQNRSTVLRITGGHFTVAATYDRPAGMPESMNNEGFAIAPNSECVGNQKPVYWSDDGDTATFSLRRGTIACVSMPPAEVPEFPVAALASVTGIALLGGVLALTRRRRPATA